MSIVVNKTRLPVTQWQTASGSIVSISDARKRYAKSLSVALEPIQDLHGYSAPWVGGAGVNAMPNAVAKTETQNGITISTNGDGIYRFSGTALSDAIIVFPLSVSFTIPSGNADTGTHSAFFMNTDINSSNVTFCFMNGSVQVDSWAMTPKNRVATAYNAMSNKVCDGIKFIIRSGISVSGTISPMFVAKGTPTDTPFSPYENLCPISGRSSVTAVRDGKNLLDFSAFSDLSNWRTDIATSGLAPTNNANKGFILPVKEGSTYTLNLDTSTEYPTYLYLCASVNGDSTVRYYITTESPSLSNIPKTFTVQSGEVWYIRMGSTLYESVFNPQIAKTHSLQLELGSATAYEPYQGISVTVQLGQTVYGGSVDLVSGVMSVDKAYALLNDPDKWVEATGTVTYRYENEYKDRKLYDNSYSGLICTAVIVKQNSSFTARWNGATQYKPGIYDNKSLISLAEVKEMASNNEIAIVYELAIPQTIQLSPNQIEMLMRNNTVWSDAGQVTLEYAKIRS